MKLQKIYLTYYSLLIVQDLWQAYYQILSVIFLKEFIGLYVNTKKMIKNVKLRELDISIDSAFLKTHLKDDLIKYKYLCCSKSYQNKFDEKTKEQFFNTYKFSDHDNNKFIY